MRYDVASYGCVCDFCGNVRRLHRPEEGTVIEAECIGKVYNSEEVDTNEWTIIGEPETQVTIKQPSTVELTCANIVNRIPDVLNAEAGFVPTSKMGEPKYRVRKLDEYLK